MFKQNGCKDKFFFFFKRLMLTEMITVVDSLGFKLAIKQDVFIETDSY